MAKLSKNQLERYPIYLKYFKELEAEGIGEISSPRIAEKLGFSQEQVRKDLQAVSDQPGRPKRGRRVSQLIDALETFLGYRKPASAVLIGVGHLGGALLNYPAFDQMGLKIQAGFDSDPAKAGTSIGGRPVYPMNELPKRMKELGAKIAVITVPSDQAQKAIDLAVSAGAKGIWNFAPGQLKVPEGVVVETVNLASSLAVLGHRMNEEAD